MKDTNNLSEYNSWTCTDYTENTDNINGLNNGLVESSNIWSVNGERCVKITRTHQSIASAGRLSQINNLTVGKTITASVVVYSPNNTVNVELYDSAFLTRAVIPKSNVPISVNLNGVLTKANYTQLRVSFNNQGDYAYFDDVYISVS